MISGRVCSERYFNSNFLSTTDRQFTFIIVSRLGARLGLGFGWFGALGDDEAWGEPKLEAEIKTLDHSSNKSFVKCRLISGLLVAFGLLGILIE